MRLISRLLLLGTILMAACGGPVASSVGAASSTTAEPTPLGSPSAAETRELSMEVSGLI